MYRRDARSMPGLTRMRNPSCGSLATMSRRCTASIRFPC